MCPRDDARRAGVGTEDRRLEAQERPARLLVADDHDLIRAGYRLVLDRQPDLEVVGEAASGREAVEMCARMLPDLVIMDVGMPEMDGLEATGEIKRRFPTVSVLIVTSHENPDYLLRAIKAGAAGYVLKGAPMPQTINSIRRVLAGESPLNQELAARLIQRVSEDAGRGVQGSPSQGSPAVAGLVEELTPREREVLVLLARGRTNPQIARDLVISRGTAKVHVQNIIRKLNVSDRTQAVVRAIDLGLIDPGSAAN